MVPMTMAIDHNTSMYFLLSPEDFISLVEATPSGRWDKNCYQKRYIYCASCSKCNSKHCIFGYVVHDGCNDNDRPEAGLLSVGILWSDPFMCPFLETLDFDFLSRLICYAIWNTSQDESQLPLLRSPSDLYWKSYRETIYLAYWFKSDYQWVSSSSHTL